ncbi:MAG TPA: hypothetical protein VHL11_18715 [Phototrophicaceae bacterium]|jgi:hypothetical protein|nr:hypothetical protein [Phototrophicaceae bacterium]
MLRIIEHTPTRLVLQDNRGGLRVLAVIFTSLSMFSLISLLLQSYQRLNRQQDDNLLNLRIAALLMFVTVSVGLVGFGVFAVFNLSRGVIFILDRTQETAILISAHRLRRVSHQYSIYAISHLQVETSPELRAYGLFLVLRSGEKIPLATFPEHEQDYLEQLIRTIHAFLR